MKQYIKDISVEELIKRLKQGELLHTTYGTHYKMIDGLLCHIGHDGKIHINSSFGYRNESNDCYFETPELIKLEVGKVYRTRNNSKVLITKHDKSRITYEYLGSIVGQKSIYDWDENGLFNHGLFKHPFDIIGEWKE